MNMREQSGRTQTGLTIAELLVTLAVLAILAGLAGPAVNNFFDGRRLTAGAEAIRDELQFARAEALSSASNLRVTDAGGVSVNFDRVADDDWRIGVSVNTGCDPRETDLNEDDACYVIIDDGNAPVDGMDTNFDGDLDTTEQDPNDRVLKVISSEDYPGVLMNAVAFGTPPVSEITFDPVRGRPKVNGDFLRQMETIELLSGNGREARVEVNLIGGLNICSPGGATKLAGYRDC